MTPVTFTTSRLIAGTSDELWLAIVDPSKVAQYHLAPLRVIELTKGGGIRYGTDEAEMISGEILEFVPGRRLVHTFQFGSAMEATREDPVTTVTYLIEPEDQGTRLTVIHSGFPKENQTYANISGGWPYILDALKIVVEKK
jgi:uncharacterized protein YndB with AHSA1/START domain